MLGVKVAMFKVELNVIPVPVRLWDLNVGDRFVLEPTGWNFDQRRFEVYLKISRSKAILDSLEGKPVVSMPKLSKEDVGYKVIEKWGKA